MKKTTHEIEWLDAKAVHQVFGLGRSVLERLVAEGRIKCASLREEGMRRGKRLYQRKSIREFLESRMEVAQ